MMLKSTDCDSQRLMQWVMGAGEEKGTRPRDCCTKLQDTTRQRRCSGHKVSFRWPVYRLRLLLRNQWGFQARPPVGLEGKLNTQSKQASWEVAA